MNSATKASRLQEWIDDAASEDAVEQEAFELSMSMPRPPCEGEPGYVAPVSK